jgi:V/A-type H+-transporting ATPase subunit C
VARLDFANARTRARSSRLAGARALRELLARPSLPARLELVRALPAGAAVPAEPGADPVAAAERGLRDGLRREALALVEAAEGRRPRRLLLAFLALDEATAVKAVLRGVARGAALDRTLAAAPPVPALPDEALRVAAASSSLEGALEALAAAGSPVAAAAREALPRVAEEGLLPLELAADRAALARAAAACRRGGEDGAVLARHVADRADARNAATLLALAGARPAVEPWVPGGRRWDEPALALLAGAGPHPPLEAARAAVARAFGLAAGDLATPWAADRALARACATALAREARARPLSLAVPLAYLAARREEVRRLALALRGAELGLPAEELLDLVEA